MSVSEAEWEEGHGGRQTEYMSLDFVGITLVCNYDTFLLVGY